MYMFINLDLYIVNLYFKYIKMILTNAYNDSSPMCTKSL